MEDIKQYLKEYRSHILTGIFIILIIFASTIYDKYLMRKTYSVFNGKIVKYERNGKMTDEFVYQYTVKKKKYFADIPCHFCKEIDIKELKKMKCLEVAVSVYSPLHSELVDGRVR